MAETVQKALVKIGQGGIILDTMDALYRYGQMMTASKIAPKSFDTPEKVMVAVQFGMERGWRPMMSLQYLYVVNQNVRIWGDAALAVCKAHALWVEDASDEHYEVDGKRVDPGDYTREEMVKANLKAVCSVGRKGGKAPVTRSFSVKNAKGASLWDKGGSWASHPARMLLYKARSFALRDVFPDAMMGLHTVEEMEGETLDVEVEVNNPGQGLGKGGKTFGFGNVSLPETTEAPKDAEVVTPPTETPADEPQAPKEPQEGAGWTMPPEEGQDAPATAPAKQEGPTVTEKVAVQLNKERVAAGVSDEDWNKLLNRFAGVGIVQVVPADKVETIRAAISMSSDNKPNAKKAAGQKSLL
jgi:hypothetical protein